MSDPSKESAWPLRRIVFWAILALAAVCGLGATFLRDLRPREGAFADFAQEWISAQNLVHGRPVYQDEVAGWELYKGRRADPEVMHPEPILKWNAHPPTSILLAVPFTGLAYPEAHLAWNLVSLLALGASLVLVGRQFGVRFTPWMLLPTVALLLVCGPFHVQLLQGQLNLVLLLLIVGVWAADRSGRPGWAGVLLGTAAAIKLFPAFLFLYFLLRRRWRAVLAGAVALAVLTGLTLAVEGWQSYWTYFSEVLPSLAKYRSAWLNASVTAFWTRLFNPATGQKVTPLWESPAAAVAGVLLSTGLIVALLARLVWRSRSREEADRAFALSVTTMLLVSPTTWDHYFLLLLVPVAWLWLRLAGGLPRAALVAVLILLWVSPAWLVVAVMGTGVLDFRHRMEGPDAAPWQVLTAISAQFYALIGLFALGLYEAKRVGVHPGPHVAAGPPEGPATHPHARVRPQYAEQEMWRADDDHAYDPGDPHQGGPEPDSKDECGGD